MDYTRFITRASSLRIPNPISSKPAGMPNEDLCPFLNLKVSTKDGWCTKLNLNETLQYTSSGGMTPLVDWLLRLQKKQHRLRNPDSTSLIVTNGSQDGLALAIDMLVSEGDKVLIDDPAYPGTLTALRPYKPKLLPVACDGSGLIPESLLSHLKGYKPSASMASSTASDIPKVLYTVPTGSNPTGASHTEKRKRQIYEIAQLYNLIILEDDPYFYLRYRRSCHVPSYLSLDTDGRVLRFDSMSKVLSSGIRIGFATGPAELIHRMILHQQVATMHASSLSQTLIFKLLEHWDYKGFEEHTHRVAHFYETQRNHMCDAIEKHLKGLVEYVRPEAGMFVWLRLVHVNDTRSLVETRAMAKGVMLVPGQVFNVDENRPSSYVRASFSIATPEQMDEVWCRTGVAAPIECHNGERLGCRRLAELIREHLCEMDRPPVNCPAVSSTKLSSASSNTVNLSEASETITAATTSVKAES